MIEKEIRSILKRLENDEDYYGDFGKQFLSNSDIRSLMRNPDEFKKSIEDNINLVKGGYFHTLVLEPEKIGNYKIIDASSRNTKLYKEESKGEMCLLLKEAEHLNNLKDKMLYNDVARDLIIDIDVEYETPGLIKLEGEWWKCKADILNHTQGFIVDIKTTSNIDAFAKSAWEYNYDSQAYIYSQCFNKDMIFLVIDKMSQQIGIFDCSDEFLERGKAKVEEAVKKYNLYFKGEEFDTNQYYTTSTL